VTTARGDRVVPVPVLAFDGCELDRQRFELRRGGARVAVEPQVFDVLAYLVTNRDRVVSKEELLDEVWGTRFVTPSTLSTRIKAARRAVGDDGERQRVIETIHGRGFRFVAPVTELPPSGPRNRTVTRTTPPPRQDIRFCRSSDGVGLAYATHGDGPVLVKVANWLTHLDHDWRSPVWRHWLHELGARYRVVRYDERGCGLSDRDVEDFSLEAWVRDLEAVLDDLELERVPLLGISQGAAVAIAYAVAHPDRVSHLVLYGSYALGPSAGERPTRHEEEAGLVVELAKVAWGRRHAAFRQLFTASFLPDGNAEQWKAFDELQRETTSAANASRFLDTFFHLDVRDLAPQVRAPTLVLHSRGDRVWSFDRGRELAACIPGSQFVPLESENHLLLEHEPAWRAFLEALDGFLPS
jgi:pimeloyl-ACP methyl ester carboxylesterase/DNA-binding winged helix-turn-helix (wHTH) protein